MSNTIHAALGDAITLYLPFMNRIMQAFPSVGGTILLVGRPDPAILVWDEPRTPGVACEYEDVAITASAREELLALVDATRVVNAQLVPFTGQEDALSVHAFRMGEGMIRLHAFVLMGGLTATRVAVIMNGPSGPQSAPDVLLFKTEVALTVNQDPARVDQAFGGMTDIRQVVEKAIQDDLALNIQGEDKDLALRWISDWHTGDLEVDREDEEGVIRFTATAGDGPEQTFIESDEYAARILEARKILVEAAVTPQAASVP